MKFTLVLLVFVVFVCGQSEEFVALDGLNEPRQRVKEVEREQDEKSKRNDEQSKMGAKQNRHIERNSVLKIDVHLSDESDFIEKNNPHSEHAKEEESNDQLLKERIDSSEPLNQETKEIDSPSTDPKNSPEEKNTRNEFQRTKNVLKSCSWIVFLIALVLGMFECSTLYYCTLAINGIIETIPSKTIGTCFGKLIDF